MIGGPFEFWGGPPVQCTAKGFAIGQFEFWDPERNAWIILVREPTKRELPAGVLEITVDEWLRLDSVVGHGHGWTYNATHKQLGGPVNWGDFPPLLTTRFGDRLYEVQFWSHHIQCWVSVVARPTGRQMPTGCVELAADTVYWVMREIHAGKRPDEVLRAALAQGR